MFTVKEAHKELSDAGFSVTLQTFYNWLKEGEIPSVKVGGAIRIRKGDLEFFLSKISGTNKQLGLDKQP